MFWRVDESIPQTYFESNLFVYETPGERSHSKHESMWFDNQELVEKEHRFDIKFIQIIWSNLVKTIGVNFIGFDFIVSSIDGS